MLDRRYIDGAKAHSLGAFQRQVQCLGRAAGESYRISATFKDSR